MTAGSRPPRREALPRGRPTPRYGLARVISKRGICSRTEAARWIADGRVRVDGRVVRDAEHPTALSARIEIDGHDAAAAGAVYIALNKPRGLVTTARDERARDTVFRCFDEAGLPYLAPVGRLDKASEGLLLFTNDSAFAHALTSPESQVEKTYHVQVDRVPGEADLAALRAGAIDDGEWLAATRITLLRSGEKQAWLEIVLDEGKNRHLRRLLATRDLGVVRLVRVAVGTLELGALAKGQWRYLTDGEVAALDPA